MIAGRRGRTLAVVGFSAALLLAASCILVSVPTRVDSLVRVVRAHKSDQATMEALVELLGVYEKKGRLTWITIHNLPERLGLRRTEARELPGMPIPFLEGEPGRRSLAVDFPHARKTLRLSFDRKSGELVEWRVKGMPTNGAQTIY
ncbi:hypothetical protein ACFL09_00455 [Planctomycetota bacterium]